MRQSSERVDFVTDTASKAIAAQLKTRIREDDWPRHDVGRWLTEIVHAIPAEFDPGTQRREDALTAAAVAWIRVAALAAAAAVETVLVAYENQDECLTDRVYDAVMDGRIAAVAGTAKEDIPS